MCNTMVQQLLLARKHMLNWLTKLESEKSHATYDLFELIFKLEKKHNLDEISKLPHKQ